MHEPSRREAPDLSRDRQKVRPDCAFLARLDRSTWRARSLLSPGAERAVEGGGYGDKHAYCTGLGTSREEPVNPLTVVVLLTSVGCATPYAYSFRLENPGARPAVAPELRDTVDDSDIRAQLFVDPTGARAVFLDLTNKTDQVLQVEWAKIVMKRSDGSSTSLRPETDLGWIVPGATTSTRLLPFALPSAGDQAAGYQGNHFELAVPMIVRRERRLYRYSFAVVVRKM